MVTSGDPIEEESISVATKRTPNLTRLATATPKSFVFLRAEKVATSKQLEKIIYGRKTTIGIGSSPRIKATEEGMIAMIMAFTMPTFHVAKNNIALTIVPVSS